MGGDEKSKDALDEFTLPEWWPTDEELQAALDAPPTPGEVGEVTIIVPSPRPRGNEPDRE
jgi:hypothetical protein